MTNVGQRKGPARMAHLFCEEFVRSEVAGLSEPGKHKACPFPVTQSMLGEALGQSTVHVNRTLQELRDLGLIAFHGGRLEILDWTKLVQLAGFNTIYLHLDDEATERHAA
jgi:CRP-like cAMP-binding protein